MLRKSFFTAAALMLLFSFALMGCAKDTDKKESLSVKNESASTA